MGFVITADSPLDEYLPIWMEEKQNLPCSTKTVMNRKTACRYVLRFAGKKRLGELRREDIEHLAEEIEASGVQNRTAWRYLTTLRAAMNTAVKQGILEKSPFCDIPMQEKLKYRAPGEQEAQMRERRVKREAEEKERQERKAARDAKRKARIMAEIEKRKMNAAQRENIHSKIQNGLLEKKTMQWEEILAAFSGSVPPLMHAQYIPLRLGACCGLTLEEALGLTWEDVDFENHVIHVRQKMVTNSFYNEPSYAPVCREAERRVKASEEVMADLRQWKSFQDKAGIRKKGLICLNIEGRPVIKREVLPMLRKLGISQPSLWSYARRTAGIDYAVNR